MSTAQPVVALPELHLVAIAKTTRKTLERLASFSHMRSSPSEPSALLNKILTRINNLVQKIDSSMLVAQMGYQLSTNAMIVCDMEDMEWEMEGSATRAGLAAQAKDGHEAAQSVMDAFRDIKQEVYKIAASTKDNMLLVFVPPDPSHADTMKIHLRDVGTGLVANLNLLSEYARAMASVAEWWQIVKDDLTSGAPSLLPTLAGAAPDDSQALNANNNASNNASNSSGDSPPRPPPPPDHFTQWMDMKQGFQEYYNVINTVQTRYAPLLPASSAAWTAVASAQSRETSSAGHSQSELPRSASQAPSSAEMQQPGGGAFSNAANRSAVSVSRSTRFMSLFRLRRPRRRYDLRSTPPLPVPAARPPSSLLSASTRELPVQSQSQSQSHSQEAGDGRDKSKEEKEKGKKGYCRSLSIIPAFIGNLGCHGLMIR